MTESVDYYDSLDVHVRWADGTDLVITISPTQDTVGTLKHKVRATWRAAPPPPNNANLIQWY